jgi:adenosylmethionine-8-amino-7-oxononanoate aminotransferase
MNKNSSNSNWVQRDLRHIWHPCSQMKDYETFPPVEIERAEESYLYTTSGKRLIDSTSSWWCKSLGHNHPRLKKALFAQAEKYEHVIGANTTQRPLVELSEELWQLAPHLQRVFYAGDGSMAVEIAMKMSLQAQALRSQENRKRFMALENGYHGESAGALGASHLGLYKAPYSALLPEVSFLKNIPYVLSAKDPLWQDCSAVWPELEKQLEEQADSLAAILVEPLLQGAGGMLLYSADFLQRLCTWASQKGIYVIADEIMTGFGRTGTALACEQAGIQPDFICLSKGLTSGWMPFSAVLISDSMYDLFYGEYTPQTSFLHSNTYTGNALGAAIALETLKVYQEEDTFAQMRENHIKWKKLFEQVASRTGLLTNIRGIGSMVAGDLILPEALQGERVGLSVFKASVELGALLRPLGNTLYWLPPLNTPWEVMEELAEVTAKSILQAMSNLNATLATSNT